MTREYTKRKGKGRPQCADCNEAPSRVKGRYKDGTARYDKRCNHCHETKYKYKYKYHKGDRCEDCGFIPKHKCQLDVDHIDGNHSNNNPDNFRTLCANCHRLKTFLQKDGWYSYQNSVL